MIFLIITDQRIDGGRLSCTGASGHDQKPVGHRRADCLPLAFIQFDPALLFDLFNTAFHLRSVAFPFDGQRAETLRDAPLGIIVGRKIDLLLILRLFAFMRSLKHFRGHEGRQVLISFFSFRIHVRLFIFRICRLRQLRHDHDPAVDLQIHKEMIDLPKIQAKKLTAPFLELFLRKPGMPVRGSHCQHVQEAAADPEFRIFRDPHFNGNAVRGPKADPVQILCQTVGI